MDDDDWTREYVRELLGRFGVDAESASDGVEAASMLDENRYEVVFLDLDLPHMPGEAVLQGLVTSRRRPASIVVMSGAPERLARIAPSEWRRLGITAALPKPLVAEDIRIAVQRMLEPAEVTLDPMSLAAPGAVLLAGGGLWLDALSSVASRGGGSVLLGRSREEALSLIATHRPEAIIAGPPLSEAELLEFCRTATASSPQSVMLAAVNRADVDLRRSLANAGVAKVCVVPSAACDLAVAMINAARLTTRAHARVRVTATATMVARGNQRLAGTTRDLSEGGLCLERMPERVARGPVRVEFGLPGDGRLVVVESEIAWSGGSNGDYRAGVRFNDMSSTDRIRIRGFVEHHQPRAAYSFD